MTDSAQKSFDSYDSKQYLSALAELKIFPFSIFYPSTMAMTIHRALPISCKVCSRIFVFLLLICFHVRNNPLVSSATVAATSENDGEEILPRLDSEPNFPWQRLPHQLHRPRTTFNSPVPSVEIDCAIRHFALEFAIQKLPWSSVAQRQDIADALRLQECPLDDTLTKAGNESDRNASSNKIDATQILRGRRTLKYSSGETSNDENTEETTIHLFVDPKNGRDGASGTEVDPLQTISFAIDCSRTLRSYQAYENAKIFLLLKGGRHYLTEPLRLDSRDSNLSIQPFGRDKTELSGGDKLSLNLSQTKENPSVYFAKLPKGHSDYNFTMLFLDRSKFGQDDVRLVWAREPNGHPERDLQPDGYARANGASAKHWPESGDGSVHFVIGKDDGTAERNSTVYPWHGEDKDPRGGGNWLHFGGFGKRFVDGKGYWNGSIPMGLNFEGSQLNTSGWTAEGYAPSIAHVFHNGFWGNWQFEIDSIETEMSANENNGELKDGRISFKRGGWQEGRGGGIGDQPFFVEGVKEALDRPGEWWLDVPEQVLYYYPFGNETTASGCEKPLEKTLKIDFVAPRLQRLIEVVGENSKDRTANNIMISGLSFLHTATTFMEQYEVPSPGDWSIHRGGAVFLENAHNTRIENCLFLRTGGNAIMVSGHAKQSQIQNNEFAWIGDSAIVTLGKIPLVDGYTVNTFPEDTLIKGNHFHEIGIHGKQTSALFSALSCKTTFVENVLYNGPRAGLNLNDQFCHGHTIRDNLLFNWVRETQDHGPINTWDRAMYIQKDDPSPNPTIIPKWTHIERNIIMNGPSGNRDLGNLFPTIDNDDGSSYFYMAKNLLVYGGGKNYLGHDKFWISNLLIFPGRWSGEGCAQIWGGKNNYFEGNTCLVAPRNPPIGLDGNMKAHDFSCIINWDDPENNLEYVGKTANNTYYLHKTEDWGFGCGNGISDNHWFTMDEMQMHGWELGSVIRDIDDLSGDDIINLAKKMLEIN